MNQIAPTSVEFHDVTLFVAIINGINYVAIKPISDALGLEWSAQFRRIKRHPVLNEAIAIMAIPSTGGEQEALALRLDKLNGWLFGISTNRVRPELRERLIQYQRECFDVLAQHFGTNNYGTPRIDVRALLLSGQSDLTIELPEHIQAALNARAGVLAGQAFTLIREHLRRRIAFGAVNGHNQLLRDDLVLNLIADGDLGDALAHEYITKIQDLFSYLNGIADAACRSRDQASEHLKALRTTY